MKLAANLSTQFSEGSWPERVRRAAAAGFRHVEMQWPYDECPAGNLRRALEEHGLKPVLINAPVGEGVFRFGHASIEDGADAFHRSVGDALAYAGEIGCPAIHVLAGVATDPGARDRMLENLAWAAGEAAGGPVLVVEAINRADVADYHLADVADAASVIATIASDRLGLMFDFYHAHRNGENTPGLIGQHAGAIRHVQISDHPGRGEPGSGTIDFGPGLAALRETGYAGVVGCEFRPTRTPEDCLGWVEGLGFSLS